VSAVHVTSMPIGTKRHFMLKRESGVSLTIVTHAGDTEWTSDKLLFVVSVPG